MIKIKRTEATHWILVVSFGLHIKPSTLIPLKKSKDLSLNTSVGCTPYHIVKDLLL